MRSIATAHAKFIVSGEHFVVDGAPAVVVPARCFETQVVLTDHSDRLQVACDYEPGIPLDPEVAYDAHARRVLYEACGRLGINVDALDAMQSAFSCRVKTSIPPGAGAGSSSALSQAMAEALIKHLYVDEVHPHYLKWFGTEIERAWHGDVSGVDNAAIAYGRMLVYQRGCAPIVIEPGRFLTFVVGSTGVRERPGSYEIMQRLKQVQPLQYAAYKQASTENALGVARCIQTGDEVQLGRLLNASHAMYRSIGLVTPRMDLGVERALFHGAYGARLTGAGCGGFILALAPIQKLEMIQQAWLAMGLTSVRTLQFGEDRLSRG